MRHRRFIFLVVLLNANVPDCVASSYRSSNVYSAFEYRGGWAMAGQVIYNRTARTLFDCTSICLTDKNCTSANFGLDTEVCEINGGNSSEEVQGRARWYHVKLTGQPRRCPYGWETWQDSCYRFFDSPSLQFHEARNYCNGMGGHLMNIDSEEENVYLVDWIQRTQSISQVWIGYTDEVNEGDWLWTEVVTSNFTNWDDGQPNNVWREQHCCVMRNMNSGSNPGKWDDAVCTNPRAFVCETKIRTHD